MAARFLAESLLVLALGCPLRHAEARRARFNVHGAPGFGGPPLEKAFPLTAAVASPKKADGDDQKLPGTTSYGHSMQKWPLLWRMELENLTNVGQGRFSDVIAADVRCAAGGGERSRLVVKMTQENGAEYAVAQRLGSSPLFLGHHGFHHVRGRREMSLLLLEAADYDLEKWMRLSGTPGREHLGAFARSALFGDLLEALELMHERGFIHGDVKPSNLLVACDTPDDPASCRGKLGDFGLSCRPGAAAGSRDDPLQCDFELYGCSFRAPEIHQAELALGDTEDLTNWRRQHLGPAADMFAAGVTYYHLLFGELPADLFQAKDEKCPSQAAALFDVESDTNFARLAEGSIEKRMLRGLLTSKMLRWSASEALHALRAMGGAAPARTPAAAAALPKCWRSMRASGDVTEWFSEGRSSAGECCCPEVEAGADARSQCQILPSRFACRAHGLAHCEAGRYVLGLWKPMGHCRCVVEPSSLEPSGLPSEWEFPHELPTR